MENDLPMSVDNYDYGETRKRTCEITGISAAQNDYSITITLSGSKTYDHQGENYSSSCNIGWKLYHGESAVADSGTAYSPDIAVGETFKAEIILYKDDLTSGSYTLQLLDTD